MGIRDAAVKEQSHARMVVSTPAVRVTGGTDSGISAVGDSDGLTIGTANSNHLVLTDPAVARFHAELTWTDGVIRLRDCGSATGTFVNGVQVKDATLSSGSTIGIGSSTIELQPPEEVSVDLEGSTAISAVHGETPAMQRVKATAERAATSDAAVLITGESGTGKDLLARAIHQHSKRRRKPFVTVDCAAMSPNLVASELFGHERGAFTGADRQHIGAFERADGGTIFLDEIGDLPVELQPNLLGALERRRFRRVGGRHDIKVDVRIIAATHRDLRTEVNEGRFRLDLYFRLAVVGLRMPALRERLDDIPQLIEQLLGDMNQTGSAAELFSVAELSAFRHHRWPGNVRELRNLVEATVAMGHSPELADALHGAGEQDDETKAFIPLHGVLQQPYKTARGEVLAHFERVYLRQLLDHAGGNVAKASRVAEMDRSHLFHMLKRHRLR